MAQPSILITGGTRGIGFSICRAFLEKGWKVTACYHQDENSAEETRKTLGPSGLFLLKKDVTQAQEVSELLEAALIHGEGLSCVLHNAGATWNARLMNVEEAEWDATLNAHLKAAFLLSKACMKPLLKQRDGQFIFLSSVVATTGNIGQAAYTAAKAGVVGLARSLAREYGSKGIRANVVCPGFHMTRLSGNLTPEAEEAIRGRHLLGRTTDLGEVCSFMLWLAQSKTVSGQVFNLDSRLPGWL